MKKKEITELHQKTKEELMKLLMEYEGELLKIETEWLLAKIKDSNVKRKKKKDIARVLTILKEKSESEVK